MRKKITGWLLCWVLAAPTPMFTQEVITARRRATAAPSISVVQGVGLCVNATTLTFTVGMTYNGNTFAAPNAGNKVSVHGLYFNSAIFSITGVAGNASGAFSQASGSPVSQSGSQFSHWINSANASDTSITVTANNINTFCAVLLEEHGLATGFDVLDTVGNVSLGSATWTTAAFTPTAGARLECGVGFESGTNTTVTGDTGWTLYGASATLVSSSSIGMACRVATADGSTPITPQGKFAGGASPTWFADGISLK